MATTISLLTSSLSLLPKQYELDENKLLMLNSSAM